MELRELATFRVVARTLNFTQAARMLGYAQSSVTAQIQSLEENVGVLLFNRMGRHVVLTDAGEHLLWYAEKLLDLAEEARAAIAVTDELHGKVTVGAPETICTYRLPAVLQAFKQRAPGAQIIFKPMSPFELHRSAREGVIDIGFLLEDPFASSALQVERLIVEDILVIAAPDHPLTQCQEVCPRDLEGMSLLLTERGCGYRTVFERILNTAGVHPVTQLEFTGIEAIKQCVIAGLGIGALPRITVEQMINQGQVCALPWSEPFSVTTQMIWHKDRWLSPAIRAFLEVSREILGGNLRQETAEGLAG
ncbi:MAG TPA: LysR family transcriptional regulator [Phototrophicaceae bacterium]|nr:LysR family transcriptional regulator [Phototrophicaceae bacterium]